MKQIKIDGFLLESKLGDLLRFVYGADDIQSQYSIGRYRFDFLVKSKKLLVEFDGDKHYTDIKTIFRDDIKNRLAVDGGFGIVRIPYFLQLTSELFNGMFNEELLIEQNFSHGFIDCNAVLPASYCMIGREKFLNNFRSYSNEIQIAILSSLQKQMKKYEMKYVIDEELFDLLRDEALPL